MKIGVIAIFDIGKTNKKFLLFNEQLKLIYCEEEKFEEVVDDDGYPCDDIEKIEGWMTQCLNEVIHEGNYEIRALNFATYGATLMFLDHQGRRITPAYNYLKPMPENVLDGFYEKWGGVEEFSRKTASPALGMLNSGLQALWLKRKKPEIFKNASRVAHLPQYLSYYFTRFLVSEYTSIGCHTAMWDFDAHNYHPWLIDEGILVPQPVSNDTISNTTIDGYVFKTGVGIHDSSASLVPYLETAKNDFILISTGTWCIFMNPFNSEPLTCDELSKDTLCYMSVQQKQVKSSRFFMGHIHDVHVNMLSSHFGESVQAYKSISSDITRIGALISIGQRVFFQHGIPDQFIDESVNLSRFSSFTEAYLQFMVDLVDVCLESLILVIPKNDKTGIVYITGGFARNDTFVHTLAMRLSGKRVFTSDIDNATALGAAMVLYHEAFQKEMPTIDLGLKEIIVPDNIKR